jgi:hypothetical protein
MIDHYDSLTERGLKVIPLRVNSKAPLCKGWQKDWDRQKSREKLRQFPDANIGLLLGDVVDVEGDSEHANRIILDLIGNYPHPAYRSTKSIHHLFLTPDPKLRLLKKQEIEFRGHGHQSVLPPSQHNGVEYSWLTEVFPVPPMPLRLHRFFESLRGSRWSKIKPGYMQVWCAACRSECCIHQKRFRLELEAFKLLGSSWECVHCRTLDLRPIVRLLRLEQEATSKCKVGSNLCDGDGPHLSKPNAMTLEAAQ